MVGTPPPPKPPKPLSLPLTLLLARRRPRRRRRQHVRHPMLQAVAVRRPGAACAAASGRPGGSAGGHVAEGQGRQRRVSPGAAGEHSRRGD